MAYDALMSRSPTAPESEEAACRPWGGAEAMAYDGVLPETLVILVEA